MTSEEKPATADAPPVLLTPRPPEDEAADEMTMLKGWMTHLRASCVRKLDGLTPEQLRWKPAAQANSIGAIVQHMAYGERWWFRIMFAGEDLPLDFKADGNRPTFALAPDATSESVRGFYEEECRLADAAIEGASLDDWSRAQLGRRTTLRWILTHQVEETARHAGHLDITREMIDGQRGR
jgi:uncharacterized damage-inducible protein DinB